MSNKSDLKEINCDKARLATMIYYICRMDINLHPERACESLPGSDDGKWIFESIFAALKNKTVAQVA